LKCIICNTESTIFQLDTGSVYTNYECSNCSLKQVDVNKRINSKKIHETEFWKEDSDYGSFTGTDFTHKKVQDLVLSWNSWFSTFKKLFNSKKILDIGSGTGISLVKFEQNGFLVTGIEPDKENTRKINQVLKKGKCINGFIEDIAFDEKFDIIWASHSLEHLEDPNLCFKKAFEFLKETGVFCVIVPDGDYLKSLKQSMKNRYHLFHYSKNSLEKLGEKHGFQIISISSYKIINKNIFRIHKITRKLGFVKISELFEPDYPFQKTSRNNGSEIRVGYKKIIK
jgi:2-polyprenyl-3-methyl-5-hydroxy-6-metoxy-1,4-benzoquinol methylase